MNMVTVNLQEEYAKTEISKILTIKTKGIKILYKGIQISLMSVRILLVTFCIHLKGEQINYFFRLI